jgi:hypothetical protein
VGHLQGKSPNALDSSDKQTLESWAENDDLTGAIAKNLLSINFGELFYLPPVDLGQGSRRGSIDGIGAMPSLSAKVYPNPAEDYVSFTFSHNIGKDIVLSLMDGSGREVKQVHIKAKAPVKTISTKDLPNGQYYYKAISGDQMISGKLSIVK